MMRYELQVQGWDENGPFAWNARDERFECLIEAKRVARTNHFQDNWRIVDVVVDRVVHEYEPSEALRLELHQAEIRRLDLIASISRQRPRNRRYRSRFMTLLDQYNISPEMSVYEPDKVNWRQEGF